MASRGDTAAHRLSPAVVHHHGNRALVELPAVIEMRTNLDDTEVDPAARPDALYADRGYDHDTYRKQVRAAGITPVIAR